MDRLSWKRKGQWSAYPDDHISRNSGVAYKTREQGLDVFGERPAWNWAEDMRDFPLFGMYDVGGRGTKRLFQHEAQRALRLGGRAGQRRACAG